MTPRTVAEVERALEEIPLVCRCAYWKHDQFNACPVPKPDYPALAAQVWAWLEEGLGDE